MSDTEVDRLNAKIADLKRTIEWYQGRTGIMMGVTARAEIAAQPAPVSGTVVARPDLALLAEVLDAHDCDELEYIEVTGKTEPTLRFKGIVERIRARLKDLPSPQVPDAPVAPDHINDAVKLVATPLPAAPAPTEQAGESIASNHDAMIILTQDFTAEQKIRTVDAHVRRQVAAALAARQAPPDLHKDFCQRCLRVHASVDCAAGDAEGRAPIDEPCTVCKGTGEERGARGYPCPTCDGMGTRQAAAGPV